LRTNAGDAAGKARQEQAGGFDRDIVEVEKVLSGRAPGRLIRQHRVAREER